MAEEGSSEMAPSSPGPPEPPAAGETILPSNVSAGFGEASTFDASAPVGQRFVLRRRVVIAGAGAAAGLAMAGGAVVAFVPRNGALLPPAERARLLQQSGLPNDFPVHPSARRMTQSAKGGFSYEVQGPVPDVFEWERQMLTRTGYEVFSTDVEGQDEFQPHWLYFSSRSGASGAILVREKGTGLTSSTEVKVLSEADPRLAVPPVGGDLSSSAGSGAAKH